MGSMLRRFHRPDLDLDPEAILLLQDAAIQFQQGLEGAVRIRRH
jgi:hypothetical protein